MSAATDPRTSQDLTGMPADAGAERAQGNLWSKRWIVILSQILVGVAILVLWELAADSGIISAALLGKPSEVVASFVGMLLGETVYGRTIYDHLIASLQVLVSGYAIAALVGVLLGAVFGRSRLLRTFQPLILAVASVPKIAIAPLFVIFLGIGAFARIAIVVIEVFFLVFFSTLRGVYEVDEEYVNALRIMGASPRQVLRKVILPAAMPDIVLGLRLGIPFAMIGVVIGEFIASNQGIGWLILWASSSFEPSALWAALAFLVAITWVLSAIAQTVEKRLLRWQPPRIAGSMRV